MLRAGYYGDEGMKMSDLYLCWTSQLIYTVPNAQET